MPLTLIMANVDVKEKLQALFISSLWYNPKWYVIVVIKTEVKTFPVSLLYTPRTESLRHLAGKRC